MRRVLVHGLFLKIRISVQQFKAAFFKQQMKLMRIKPEETDVAKFFIDQLAVFVQQAVAVLHYQALVLVIDDRRLMTNQARAVGTFALFAQTPVARLILLQFLPGEKQGDGADCPGPGNSAEAGPL